MTLNMKKMLIALSLLFITTSSYATVNPPNLRNCAANVSGKVTGLYSDNWAQKAAIKIGDNFYYLSYTTKDANVRTTYNTAVTAYVSGSNVKIMECQGNHINSILVTY